MEREGRGEKGKGRVGEEKGREDCPPVGESGSASGSPAIPDDSGKTVRTIVFI